MDFNIVCQNLFDHYVACYRAKDASGCASIYSPDAELYSPFGPPSIGRAAIQATHEQWVQEDGEDKQITVTSAGCSESLGWCVANFSEGGAVEGLSVNILARQPGGSWLVTHCSLNEAQES